MTKKNPNSNGEMREKSSNILEKFNCMAIGLIYTQHFLEKKSVAKNTDYSSVTLQIIQVLHYRLSSLILRVN